MPFPLPFVPIESYKTGRRRFGADRDQGRRKHAGCDLIAPLGTPVFAVADGVVMEAAEHEFYRGTRAVAIQTPWLCRALLRGQGDRPWDSSRQLRSCRHCNRVRR